MERLARCRFDRPEATKPLGPFESTTARRTTPATRDAASELLPRRSRFCGLWCWTRPKEHVPFADVKVDGAVGLVTTRPKTTLRKTRRFGAPWTFFTGSESSRVVRARGPRCRGAAPRRRLRTRTHARALRDGIGSAILFFGNRAGESRVARGCPGHNDRDRSLVVPETDLGFAGLVAEALFREIAVARADAPDGVEFVVTLQVVADVIVAPAGPGASA